MSIDAAQAEVIEEFGFFDNWLDKYQYLIDLGSQTSGTSRRNAVTDEYRLHGCQSQVWLRANENGDSRLRIRG